MDMTKMLHPIISYATNSNLAHLPRQNENYDFNTWKYVGFCAIRTNIENVQKLYFGNILAWFLADRHEKFMQNSLHSFFNIHRNFGHAEAQAHNHIAFYGILTHSLELDLAIFWMTTTTTTTSMTMTTEMMMTMAASFYLLSIRWFVSGEKRISPISCKCWRIKFKRFSFVPLSKSCQCPYMQIHTETFIRIGVYMVFRGVWMNGMNGGLGRKIEETRKLNSVRRP